MEVNEEANEAFVLDNQQFNASQNESQAKKDNECKGK
jgi:hypothetical protein